MPLQQSTVNNRVRQFTTELPTSKHLESSDSDAPDYGVPAFEFHLNRIIANLTYEGYLQWRRSTFEYAVEKISQWHNKFIPAASIEKEEVDRYMDEVKRMEYPVATKFPCPFSIERPLDTDCHMSAGFPEIGQLLQHIRRKHLSDEQHKLEDHTKTKEKEEKKRLKGKENTKPKDPEKDQNSVLEEEKAKPTKTSRVKASISATAKTGPDERSKISPIYPATVLTNEAYNNLKTISTQLRTERRTEDKCTNPNCHYVNGRIPDGDGDIKAGGTKSDSGVVCCKACDQARWRRFGFVCRKLLGGERWRRIESKMAEENWQLVHHVRNVVHETKVLALVMHMAQDYVNRWNLPKEALSLQTAVSPDTFGVGTGLNNDDSSLLDYGSINDNDFAVWDNIAIPIDSINNSDALVTNKSMAIETNSVLPAASFVAPIGHKRSLEYGTTTTRKRLNTTSLSGTTPLPITQTRVSIPDLFSFPNTYDYQAGNDDDFSSDSLAQEFGNDLNNQLTKAANHEEQKKQENNRQVRLKNVHNVNQPVGAPPMGIFIENMASAMNMEAPSNARKDFSFPVLSNPQASYGMMPSESQQSFQGQKIRQGLRRIHSLNENMMKMAQGQSYMGSQVNEQMVSGLGMQVQSDIDAAMTFTISDEYNTFGI